MAISEECFSFPLPSTRPLELCKEGNFQKLFALYYDNEATKNIYGCQPTDYLVEPNSRNDIASNMEAKRQMRKLRHEMSQENFESHRLLLDFKGYQPIHYAAAHGDLNAVCKLVEKYKCCPKPWYTLKSPLGIACYYGHLDVVKYLVVDCECYTADTEETIFSLSCNKVEVAIKTCFLHKQPEEPEFQFEGKIGSDHIAIIKFLLKHGGAKKLSRIAAASLRLVMLQGTYDDLEIFEELSLDIKKMLSNSVNSGVHRLSYIEFVVFGNNLLMMEQLLANKVIHSNAKLIEHSWHCQASNEMLFLIISKCPSNPIYDILQQSQSLIEFVMKHYLNQYYVPVTIDVKFLLDCLLDFFGNTADSNGRNILHYICKNNPNHGLAKHVLEKMPRLQLKPDSNRQLPVHIACSILKANSFPDDGILNLVKVVSSDCNIDACDIDGNTPLHIVLMNHNWKTAEYLVNVKEASVTLKNNEGIIPLHIIRFFNLKIDSPVPESYDINQVDQNGDTLLHIACKRANIADIETLVCAKHALVHIANSAGQTPLHIVLSNWWVQDHLDDMEEIIRLLSDERTITLPDNYGRTPLHIACSFIDHKILAKGLAKKLAPSSTSGIYSKAGKLPVHILLNQITILSDDSVLLSKLLLEEIDVNLPDSDGSTPLHFACRSNCKDLILYLVKRGAMTQVQNSERQLPLHLLLYCSCRDLQLINLLNTSRSLHTQDNDGNTPLHIFFSRCLTIAIDYEVLLLEHVRFQPVASYSTLRQDALICLNLKNDHDITPLQVLITRVQSSQKILELVATFCSTQIKSIFYQKLSSQSQFHSHSYHILSNFITCIDRNFNRNLLHVMLTEISLDCTDVFSLIPNIKELVNVPDERGETPLHVACKLSKVKAVQIFLELNNSSDFINAQTCRGETALHVVFHHRSLRAAKLLLQQDNCISNLKDYHGNIPLHYASEMYLDAVKLLKITSKDVTTVNENRRSPIHNAVLSHNLGVVEYLHEQCDFSDIVAMVIDKGSELPFETFLKMLTEVCFFLIDHFCFEREGDVHKMAGYFAEQKLNFNFIERLNSNEKEILFQFVCRVGFVETQKYLREETSFIARNCSLKSPPYSYIDRITLLQMAAWFGRTDIVEYLMAVENIDPCSVDKGRNTLYYACKYTNLLFTENDSAPSMDTIKILIESGCEILFCPPETYVNGYHIWPLFENICRHQDLHLLRAVTAIPESANAQDRDGNTPLMLVIINWHGQKKLEASKILIQERGCDQTLTNNRGYSALHLACQSDSLLDIVKLLDLSHVHDEERHGSSPLECALQQGNVEILKHLIKHCDIQPLNINFLHNNPNSAKHLLSIIDLKQIISYPEELLYSTMRFSILHGYKYNINISLLENNSDMDASRNTLLHIACRYNVAKLVNRLVKQYKHSLLPNNSGDTPLHVACAHNRCKIVKILVGQGADVTARNANGDTALHIACRNASYKSVKLLATSSTEECNIQNNCGDTPFHLACSVQSCACIVALPKGGLCVQNNAGDTPLHIACRLGSLSIVYYLLSHFTRFCEAPSLTNEHGQLPLHYALQKLHKQHITFIRLLAVFKLMNLTPDLCKHDDLMELACQCKTSQGYMIAQHFKNKGVRIEPQNPHNPRKIPIHYAASKALKLVKLCASLSTINSQDNEGNTALHIACSRGKFSICKYLVCEMKCDISIQNSRGETALHKACNVPFIRFDICLLLLKAESFIPDNSDNYPLHCLCKRSFNIKILLKMVEALEMAGKLESMSHPNDSHEMPLHYLCKSREQNAVNAVEVLIPYTEDLNAKSLSGEAPIHLACMSEQHGIIQLLAKQQMCDITISNAGEDLPLHLVCQMRIIIDLDEAFVDLKKVPLGQDHINKLQKMVENSLTIVLTLKALATEECVNAINRCEDTPLHLLLKNKYLEYADTYFFYSIWELHALYYEILNVLLERGASINNRNASLELPIHVACRFQNLPAIEMIGNYGISDEITLDGNSVFHCACQNQYVLIEIFEYLENELGGKKCLDKKNNFGDSPLHVYCKFQEYGREDCMKYLLEHSDVNSQNDDGNTPFHLLLQNSWIYNEDIFKIFIHDEKCDLTLKNSNGETALDLIVNKYHFLAKEIVEYNFSTSRIQKLQHILSHASDDFISRIYLDSAEVAKILTEIEIDPAPLYRAHKTFFSHDQTALQIPVSMLFIGDVMTGKTTLVNSLRKEAGEKITECEPDRTAGTIPTSIQSSQYGLVTAYDFAGQREYYAGHEAVMQSIVQKTPPIVLIHVKLSTPEGEIMKKEIIRGVTYWNSFIKNRLEGTISDSMKAPIIVICSHADYLQDKSKVDPLSTKIRSLFSTNKQVKLCDIIYIDCRQSGSPDMSHLVSLLARCTGDLRHKGATSFKAHCLYVLITQHLKSKVSATMNEIFQLQSTKQNLFTKKFEDFKKRCEELVANGQIILLKDNIPRRSLIILDSKVFLNDLMGKLFAPAEFLIHERISSSTGVVTFSKIESLFPQYDPNMVIRFLSLMECCFEVWDKIILEYILKEKISPDTRYFFFPNFVEVERPPNLCGEDLPLSKFCWVLKSEEKNFFHPSSFKYYYCVWYLDVHKFL